VYISEFKKFRDFCKREQLTWLPTHPEALSYYLLTRAGEGVAPKTLDRIVASIRWCHELTDRSFSFDDAMVRGTLRFCRRNWKGGAKDEPPPEPPEQPDATPTEKEPAHVS
jgi:hypothetical protein